MTVAVHETSMQEANDRTLRSHIRESQSVHSLVNDSMMDNFPENAMDEPLLPDREHIARMQDSTTSLESRAQPPELAATATTWNTSATSSEQSLTSSNRQTVCEAEPKSVCEPVRKKHSIKLVPLQDHSHPSAPQTKVVMRKLGSDGVVQLGRTEGEAQKVRAIVYFSKVVSRKHAELVLRNDEWYIRDVGSSSGTFVNNNRSSPVNTKSDSYRSYSGDVLRFGVDFRGGQEPHFRSVRVRIELDGVAYCAPQGYQKTQLDKLSHAMPAQGNRDLGTLDSCAICLEPLAATSASFVSPCFHMWHYRCIRASVVNNYPYFDCPLCRKTFDLEETSDCEADSVDEAEDD